MLLLTTRRYCYYWQNWDRVDQKVYLYILVSENVIFSSCTFTQVNTLNWKDERSSHTVTLFTTSAHTMFLIPPQERLGLLLFQRFVGNYRAKILLYPFVWLFSSITNYSHRSKLRVIPSFLLPLLLFSYLHPFIHFHRSVLSATFFQPDQEASILVFGKHPSPSLLFSLYIPCWLIKLPCFVYTLDASKELAFVGCL